MHLPYIAKVMERYASFVEKQIPLCYLLPICGKEKFIILIIAFILAVRTISLWCLFWSAHWIRRDKRVMVKFWLDGCPIHVICLSFRRTFAIGANAFISLRSTVTVATFTKALKRWIVKWVIFLPPPPPTTSTAPRAIPLPPLPYAEVDIELFLNYLELDLLLLKIRLIRQ